MVEKRDKEEKNGKQLEPDARFKYVGFEVHPGKIDDLFESDAEKEKWVERVREKRRGGSRLREKNSFEEPRVAGYERIILAITSLLLVVSLFLPWFSGYSVHEVEAKVTTEAEEMAVLTDSSMIDSLMDSMAIAAIEATTEDSLPVANAATAESEVIPSGELAEETTSNKAEAVDEIGTVILEKDEHGFASITGAKIRKEIRKEYHRASAVGSLGLIGDVFSSGIVLKISGLLFLIYMLLCVALAFYTLYVIFGFKGDADTVALKLKQVLRYNWIPVGIWFFCMIISFFGASYSFNLGDGGLTQLGDSYGVGVYLSILGYGFYVSLACFIMNAVKAIEI